MNVARSGLPALAVLLSLTVPVACTSATPEPDGSGGHGGTGLNDSCEFGDDAAKCGGSDDFACVPELTPTTQSCDEDIDCDEGELCFVSSEDEAEGTCQGIVGTCADLTSPSSGKPFGESCDPNASTDPCAGECVAIGDGGECEETCRVGADSGCHEEEIVGSGVACAFFAYDLSDAGIEQGVGDLGVCATLCNCNADCPGDQLCLSAPTEAFDGICAGGIDVDASIEDCMDGGGGAGGADG